MKYLKKKFAALTIIALAISTLGAHAAVEGSVGVRSSGLDDFGSPGTHETMQSPAAADWTPWGTASANHAAPVPAIRSSRMPRQTRMPPKTDSLGVFSSIAISAARLPATAKWRAVSSRNYSELFTDECDKSGLLGCQSAFASKLRALSSRVHGMAADQVLDEVNGSVNAAMRYRSDSQNWGQGDYWANPTETALKGAGDCEDFAIAKYWLLRSLGYAATDLQIVVLSDTRRQLYHAVLVAHVDGTAYVLDNLSSQVLADTRYPNYVPVMSFADDRSYIHGFTGKNAAIAALPSDMHLVSPGEGI